MAMLRDAFRRVRGAAASRFAIPEEAIFLAAEDGWTLLHVAIVARDATMVEWIAEKCKRAGARGAAAVNAVNEKGCVKSSAEWSDGRQRRPRLLRPASGAPNPSSLLPPLPASFSCVSLPSAFRRGSLPCLPRRPGTRR